MIVKKGRTERGDTLGGLGSMVAEILIPILVCLPGGSLFMVVLYRSVSCRVKYVFLAN